MITITIWHNVAYDAEGRHSAMLDGYQPGDPVVAVFTYQADPAGRTAEQIAAEAFDTFNDHPRDPNGADLACAYYQRRLRSLSFPGKLPCCPRSCCICHSALLPDDGLPDGDRTPGCAQDGVLGHLLGQRCFSGLHPAPGGFGAPAAGDEARE